MFDISTEREAKIRDILEGIMAISEIGSEQFRITVIGNFIIPLADAVQQIKERARSRDLMPLFRIKHKQILIQFVPKLPRPKKTNYAVNIILFILTIMTTMFAGALQQGVNPFLQLYVGIPFSVTIILILGAHELGHYFASKRCGIDATLPYFIPFPHLIGTFGAVIKVKEPITDKKALLEIGVAGPLIGMIFAIPAVVIGLKLSTVIPVREGGLGLGDSFLFTFLSRLVLGVLPEGKDILLHPIAFAGWIGFFVTALNLLPVGQLDGGHVLYGLIGRNQKWFGWAVFCSLFIFGFLWQGWFLWAVLIVTLIKIQHPPPLDDISPIPLKHHIFGWLAMVILVLTFTPSPFIFP